MRETESAEGLVSDEEMTWSAGIPPQLYIMYFGVEVKCGVVRQACASALCVSCVLLCFIFVRQLCVEALSLFFICCASVLCFSFKIRGCVSCVFVLRFASCFVRRALCISFSFQFPALSCLSFEPQLRSVA